jgi:3-isopropylmalate dehydratase small subunit
MDENGKLLDDIDTDQIYHNSHLAVTNIEEMGDYALGNLPGYEDFPEKVTEGDILIAGKNFGSGSSRQQAVDCFQSLGVGALLASSFGAIYKRNAVNSAFPVFSIQELADQNLRNGDIISFDTETGKINKGCDSVGKIRVPSKVQMEIMDAGGLFEYGRRIT